MRVYVNKWFARFMRRESIRTAWLHKMVRDVERGLVDADYGGGVIKQRLARSGQGKSGGYRCILLCRRHDRAFFVYGFLKSERSTLDGDEVKAFKDLADVTFALSSDVLDQLIKQGVYMEVENDGASDL